MKEELGLDYPILSDEDLDFIRKTDLVDPKAPKSLRGFAILNEAGEVIYSQEVNPFGQEAEGIFQFAAEELTKQQ